MTMIFNGTELEEVRFNGVDCEKVYMNGVLVFEKAAGHIIEIIDYGGDQFGGLVSPNHPVFGEIYAVDFVHGEAGGDREVHMNCTNQSHNGRVRMTIAGVVIVLSKHYRAAWFGMPTLAQYNALPRSGTHPILIEAIP